MSRITLRFNLRKPSRPAWLRTPRIAAPIAQQLRHRLPYFRKPHIRPQTLLGIGVLLLAELVTVIQPYFTAYAYTLGNAESLLLPVSQAMTQKLRYDAQQRVFNFNAGYSPAAGDSQGSSNTQITATASQDPTKGISVTDPINKANFSLTPEFPLETGQQNGNRVIYPLSDRSGWVVYGMHSIGVKEDILLTHASGDRLSLTYKLGLDSRLSARIEPDGSIGVYGNKLLSGNITTGSSKDAALLENARKNAPKDTLMFTIPAPLIKETGKAQSQVKAAYTLKGDELTVTSTGLKKASYPLTIDPSVYVTTAQQFMNGNNETNIDFDVADALIQKGQTTGARFDSWNSTRSLNTSVWQLGVAAAGGYIYTAGGNYPNGLSSVFNTQGSATYRVPAGQTSITVNMWGAGGGGGGGGNGGPGGAGGGGGFIKSTIPVSAGETLNVYVGGAGGGGAGNGTNSGAGGGGGGYSSVMRGTTPLAVAAGGAGGGGGGRTGGYNGGDGGAGGGSTGISGSAGTGGNGGGNGGSQSAGGAGGTGGNNSGSAGSYLTGGAGADGRSNQGTDGSAANGGLSTGGDGGQRDVTTRYAGGGGGGAGYYGGGGGSGSGSSQAAGGGGGGSSYASGSNTTNTAGNGTTPGNDTDSNRNGAGQGGNGGATNGRTGADGSNGLIIISAGTGSTNTGSLTWAKFNPTSGTIDSANPGSGTCSGWCTTSAYDLPSPRSSVALVAYNGFLYAIGGEDQGCTAANGTGDNGICKTVYVAKLGANGEPRLWHPTDTNKDNWVYWYRDADLTSPRSMTEAIPYNNRLYLLGGKTSSSGTTSITNTTQVADVTATGKLGSWTNSTALPYSLYGHGAQAYNDRLYIIGGASSIGGAPLSSVYYTKVNADGSLNNWVQTSSLTGGRLTEGGNFTTSWGGYIYLSGGCTTVNSSGYCTQLAGDTQLASINADGSLDTWETNKAVTDARMGHNIVAWRNYIYEIGGCTAQSTSTGACSTPLNSINYGTINQDGDVSLLSSSSTNNSGTCSGSSPYNCNLPPPGNNAGQIGQMLSANAVINGYLYVSGGCTNTACTAASDNTAYATISNNGSLTQPANCTADGNTLYGSWCVDSQHSISNGGRGRNGTTGIAAGGTAVFGNQIYLVGGLDGGGNTNQIYHTTVNADGSLSSSGWTLQTLSGAGAQGVSYEFAYIRSNPGAASTAPANLFIFGGCSNTNGASCTSYTDAVYKCDVQSTGVIANCSSDSQLQIGTVSGGTSAGLAGMGGTVYAGYIYLIGGVAPGANGLATVRYAKFDNSNNVVAVNGTSWVESSNAIASSRQLSSAFGYNGYIYVMGGYNSGSGVLNDIEFAKINVSDGSIGTFKTSTSTLSPRWGLKVIVSNSYAYVLGGCQTGAAPGGCSSMQPTVDVVEIYNNDSGAPAGYTTAANTYSTAPNRLGVSSTVLNDYIYVAGGCTSTTDCTTATNNVSYAKLASDGSVGAWASTGATLPAARTWGKLVTAGGSLYYIGGQDSSGAASAQIYYGTPATTGNVTSWGTSTNNLPDVRKNFGAAVWNNRIYVIGGVNGVAGTASFTTSGPHTFKVPAGISSITVKAWGAGGGGGGGGGGGTGGAGGGGGYATTILNVTGGETLSVPVGGGGTRGNGSSNSGGAGGGGGGYSGVLRSSTPLIVAAGGAGGGGASNGGGFFVTSNGGDGGAGGDNTAGVGGTASSNAGGGGGATPTAGGAGGTGGDNDGTAGSSLLGGAGADGRNVQGADGGANNAGVTGGGAGGLGGVAANYAGGGGAGGGYYGGGGGSGSYNGGGGFFGGISGGGGGGSGTSYTAGTSSNVVAGSGQTPGNGADPDAGTAGQGGNGGARNGTGTSGTDGKVIISYGNTDSLYISPQLNSGGNIASAWTSSSSSINAPRSGLTAVAYANNLYIFGGNDGSNYLSDSQYAQINPKDGTVGAWSYSTSLPQPLAQADGFAANGYIYLIGGRSDASTCSPTTLVAPISANTTIASGNHPTGMGQWYEANQEYSGNRYGAAAVYHDGKAYVLGGACGSSTLTYASPAVQQTTLLSQPQVAKYSIMMDTDSDVTPNYWLINGLDNSIGARWQLKYRSMTNTATSCSSPAMTTWGQDVNFGNVTLGLPGAYIPKDGAGTTLSCARFYDFNVTVDSSQAFGYPDDVSRGPTITDLTLQFTADPSKRLMHGRTFTGGLQQPDDTPLYTY